jgi:pimeloyl-ACP methyl ester carboxylesterase
VWAIDFVGQGESWPSEDDAVEVGFRYSVETWAEQVEFFLREVVQTECFLVGNSLGGYVSTLVAARNRSLVRGLMLLNATPFWAFVPNDPNSIGSRHRSVARGASRAEMDLWSHFDVLAKL